MHNARRLLPVFWGGVLTLFAGPAGRLVANAIDDPLSEPFVYSCSCESAGPGDMADCLDCGDVCECGEEICSRGADVAALAYGGPCMTRATLTADWCGQRSALASSGLTVAADSTNFYFGNNHGGLRRDWEFGGHDDYVFNLDGGKAGLMEGMFFKVRAEHRYGRDINGDTGAIIPSTLLTELPVANSEDVYFTDVLLTQALSENFAVFAGKLDTLDADANAFASGRGKTQFSNLAFVATPLALRALPYSTLGCGFIVLVEKQPLLQVSCLNATDTTKTSGFDELFNDGCVLAAEAHLPTPLIGGMPGGQTLGGAWSSKNFTSLGQDPRIILPDVPIAEKSDSWVLYWNTHQYLVVDSGDPLRGWGYFARAGVADKDTNPIEHFLEFGFGGSSPLASRPADTFGVGWYRAYASDEIGVFLQTALGPLGDGQGVEAFYNIAVTPWCHITPDVQYIAPSREVVNDALVAGLRANVNF
jgi:porin